MALPLPGKMMTKAFSTKQKPDADVIKVARGTIAELQVYSIVNVDWERGNVDTRSPPYIQHEELNMYTDILT
jgi:hypothetical protein